MLNNPHLGEDDLDDLLGKQLGFATSSGGRDSLPHVQGCAACREQLEALRQFVGQLRNLHPAEPVESLASCPQEDVWLLLAAGLLLPARAEALLDHAIGCDACGLQLHHALSDLSEASTPDEAAVLTAQPTSARSWQLSFARRLRTRFAPDPVSRTFFWPRFLNLQFYAWTAVALALVAVVSWVGFRSTHDSDPSALLAAAYAEKRTIEPRIGSAAWTPLRLERGADLAASRMERNALLRAEAEIADHLRRDPDNVLWIDASGRAAMLENTEDSVQAAAVILEKANRLDPGNPTVSIDLASAYLLRAQFFNRPEDATLAVELLSRLLASDPGNETAAFNYALALEKLQLKQRSITAWSSFLDRFPSSSWSREARQHRDALQSQVTGRIQRGQAPLLAPAAFADALASANPNVIDTLDARVEQYRELALAQWLPRAMDASARASPESRALNALAELLASRNSDVWFRDLLSSLRAQSSATDAYRALSQAAATLETSNDALARAKAQKALDGFTRAGIASGRLQAGLFLAHLDQYAHRNAACEQRARSLLADPAIANYPWLRIDTQLEHDFCSRVGGRAALHDIQSSLSLAASHHFSILALRARAATIGLDATRGDLHASWVDTTDALSDWWNSSTPLIRGYNLLVTVNETYFSRPNWYVETEILAEALPLVANDPRTGMVAALHALLALAQTHTGDTSGAVISFDRAARLIGNTPPGPERDYLSAEIDLGLARIDLAHNKPQTAVQRIDRIRPRLLAIAHNRLILDFFETSSEAYLRAGLPERAEQDLRTGIALDQASLPQIASDNDRLSWVRLHEPLYRRLVELELRRDPASAFALWQDFKGAVLRSTLHLPAASPSTALLPRGTVLVSYFQMPAGLFIWVRNGSQLHGRLVPVADSTLHLAAANLIERCSDPNTSADAWRPHAARLYQLLIAPVEPWLDGATSIVIEPDGSLKQLPFALLLDPRGTLLTDRFPLAISPGLDFLRAARAWTGITPASRALIVGNSSVSGWAPLPEVVTEVRAVAASFLHPDLVNGATPNPSSLAAAQIFHFSGHAEASPRTVQLVQAHDSSAAAFDFGSLRRSELVVLSACSTAQGATGLFDDADSPVHRLLAARVPSVVASRWNVDSEATALLMQFFYMALLQGAEPAEALSRAARAVRSQTPYSHPYYWASFAVYGRG